CRGTIEAERIRWAQRLALWAQRLALRTDAQPPLSLGLDEMKDVILHKTSIAVPALEPSSDRRQIIEELQCVDRHAHYFSTTLEIEKGETGKILEVKGNPPRRCLIDRGGMVRNVVFNRISEVILDAGLLSSEQRIRIHLAPCGGRKKRHSKA